jgi:polyhydroxybutyrate depolymerase
MRYSFAMCPMSNRSVLHAMISYFTRRQILASGLALVLVSAGHCANAGQLSTETYGGRDAVVYKPIHLPPFGSRALVVVLHGGLGNAQRIASQRSESALNMNAVAEQGGFLVAYLNGTPVTRLVGADKLGWNAGACCGVPAEKNVNDVGYILAAVEDMAAKYGVERSRIFGVGHSNGAMMTQRVMCEANLYAAAVPVSGPLDTGVHSCPTARGKPLMAIHGADDQNVPIGGGLGTKSLSRTGFASQAATARVWQNSGAGYELQVIQGADHSVDAINAQIVKVESQTLAQKIARFFGLTTR